MTTTASLGNWCLARCQLEKEEGELTICEPASEDSPAISLVITGWPAIIDLRNLIDEELSKFSLRAELDEDDIPQ